MKRKTAKEILAESFRELAGVKHIDKITVKDITDNCGYSPATFYRQFRDKYDLIAWAYTWGVSSIMDRIGQDRYEWKQTLLDGAIQFQKEKEVLTNLLLHTSGHESFVQYMTDINSSELTRYIKKASGKETLDQTTEMYIRLYCMGTVCLTCEWILGKYDASPEELAAIYENSLPDPLKPFLLS
ncbi:MAG: TetR/AcrR family transcriptional regulator C-terminal domain-containing protein [Eubacterium sp.]|nr:TetR/AcrR family transcriptional regulator C-terminal domain-containing protein [Eubacterium sp.]